MTRVDVKKGTWIDIPVAVPPITIEDVWDIKDGVKIGGDGSDGDLVVTGTTYLEPGRWYNFSSINIQSGGTLTVSGYMNGKPLLIRCSGDCTIAGTIDLRGKGFPAGKGYSPEARSVDVSLPVLSYWGSPGGNAKRATDSVDGYPGRGGIRIMHATDTDVNIWVVSWKNKNAVLYPVFCGTGGGYGATDYATGGPRGGGGGGGSSPVASGSNGSGGNVGGWSHISSNGTPGAGGGALYLEVGGDLNFTGTIDVRGTDGTTSTDGGGPGGGGGGQVWIRVVGTVTDTGTKLYSGGAGGSGTHYSGGNGGDGEIVIESV